MLKRFHLNLYFNNLFIVNSLIFYFDNLRKIKFALIFCFLTFKIAKNGCKNRHLWGLFFFFLPKKPKHPTVRESVPWRGVWKPLAGGVGASRGGVSTSCDLRQWGFLADRGRFTVEVEQLTADTIKVALSAPKAAQIRQGKWSAVVESGDPRQIVSVHRDIIVVDTRKYCAEIELLRAFCSTIPTIELAGLKKKF